MTFDDILDQAIEMLQRRKRLSYRALKRQFDLDDDYLEDLKLEIIKVQQLAVDQDGEMLVWIGESGTQPEPASTPPAQSEVTEQDRPTPIEPLTTEPSIPEAERRQLTVMFSDLVDSTKLAGHLDPEDYREVLRAYQSACAEVIHRFDGYIAQHLGDALLVYFGFPTAHEDDAQRAIHTGLGMLQAMKTLNTRLEQDKGIRLAIRVGIHTGLTVVGDIGEGQKHEMLALGEAPNVASRIQGRAEPDTIAVSEATYRLIEGYFTVEDLGLHTLKGVAEPQQVYRVLQESGAQSRLDIASARGLTPLVGREQEVGLLLERWNQAKDGQGQVVLLSGEGGIGKSRLVQVLKEHVADGEHRRWECRSSPYYENTALYPITDLLQRTLQFQSDDAAEQRLEKLEQELSQYRLSLEEAVPLFAPLLSLSIPEERYPPLNLSPQRQRQKTLESIVAILLEQAEQQPVLFILEDGHWCDNSTLEMLDLFIEQTPTARILTLLTYRPEFQPSWTNRSYLTQVTLNRLTQSQIAGMAERVAGGKHLPEEVLQQIIEKTDGVPLFVEEMTKAVLESGVLKEIDGHYELTGPLTSLTIPATLQDSLMARLDRLVTAKAVAQYAAVIGRQFSYELLHAVSQLDTATLQRELGRLVEAELVYPRGLPPHATYIFKHALVSDAAYQSLLRSTRQGYHQRIARVLEEQFPATVETQPELLAHHYTEAGLSEQAVGYWQLAGERTLQRSANMEAIAHLTKGLELLKTLPETSEHALQELTLQRDLGVSLLATKGFAAPEVEHAYIRARALCEQVQDTQQVFPVLFGLWGFYNVRQELQTARELAEQLLALAQRQHDPALILQGHVALGTTLCWLGAFRPALVHLEQGIALYDPQQHAHHAFLYGQDPGMGCLVFAAHTLWYLGYPEQSLQRSHEALVLMQELSHPFSLTFALIVAIHIRIRRREWHAVQEHAEASIALSTEQGFAQWLALGTCFRGLALVAQGHEEGIALMRQGITARQSTGARVRLTHLILFVEALKMVGQNDEGLNILAEVLPLIDTMGERCYEAELHRLKGALLLQQSSDNAAEAASCFQKAIDVAQNQSAKSWELRAATSLARLWQKQDKRKEAYDLLAPVYGWFTEGFDTADLKDAKSLLDELS